MEIEFDPAKSEKNRLERNLPFELAAEFDWGGASCSEDVRNPYPEKRFVAVGYLGKRLHVVCFSPVPGGPAHQLSKGKRQGGNSIWQNDYH